MALKKLSIIAGLAAFAVASAASAADGRVMGCEPEQDFAHKQDYLVNFATGSTAVNADDRAELKKAAKWARDRYIQKICVIGRADPRGNPEYNRQLSLKRAKAVAGILRAEGIGSAKIATHAVGEAPSSFFGLIDNDNTEDRRVEVIMVK